MHSTNLDSLVNELTLILQSAHADDPHCAEKLLPLVYEDLRRIAVARMSRQPAGHTLQATALVHEAYLRLIGNPEATWHDRRHFFAAASEAMRHILVDRARRKSAVRHGAGLVRHEFNEAVLAAHSEDDVVLAVSDALVRLAQQDPMAAELVRLRFFAGFTFAQAAELLDISERTAKRNWVYARAWLYEEIRRTQPIAV